MAFNERTTYQPCAVHGDCDRPPSGPVKLDMKKLAFQLSTHGAEVQPASAWYVRMDL